MDGSRVVFWINGSISSWRVLLTAYELGLAFDARRLLIMGAVRQTRSPEFLRLNPRGKAPVLVEPDGTVLNESLAILHFLALRYPEPSLLPSPESPRALARVLALVQESETFANAYEPLEQLFLVSPKQASAELKSSLKEARDAVSQELSWWEARASDVFLAGPGLSLADCAFYPVLAYLQRRGLSLVGHPACGPMPSVCRRVRR